MLRIFTFLLIICSQWLQAQTSSYPKFEISGIIYSSYVYYGGIARDDSNIKPIPLPNYMLYLVRWNESDSTPVVITSVTTNEDGEFKARVPMGIYGFAMIEEIDSLDKGHCIPKHTEIWQGHHVTSTNWQMTPSGPVNLTSGPVANIVLICHKHVLCIDCP